MPLILTDKNLKDAEYLSILRDQLKTEFNNVYYFTALRNVGKNDWRVSSAKRLSFGIDIPKKYIVEDSVQIGDLVLTEMTKEEHHKYLVKKFIVKLIKTIRFCERMHSDTPNKFAISKDIYDDVMAYFKGERFPENLVIEVV